jgi:transcription-repair coupling factor (superfamily II helicase)
MTASPLLPIASLPLPTAGARVDWPRLAGSGDALALAELARRAGKPVAVVTAHPLDAQRLQEEIRWLDADLRTHLLPDWETLPYDPLSPHQDLVSERLATLYAVMRGEVDLLLIPATTALYRMAPRSHLAAHTFFLAQGDRLNLDALRAQLELGGYSHVTQVVSPGEYSVRGGLVDLYPMGAALPLRIELFDDEIETIRTFDADSQRTVYPVKDIRLLPAREFPMDDAARVRFRAQFRASFEGDTTKSPIYKDVSNGVPSAGIEYYLPLFFDHTETLFDYLPADALLVLHRDVPGAIAEFWHDTRSRYELMRGDRVRPLLPPTELFLTDEAFFTATHVRAVIRLQQDGADTVTQPLPDLAIDRKADDPTHRLRTFAAAFAGRVLVLAESAGRRETMHELFDEYGLATAPAGSFAEALAAGEALLLGVGPLAAGLVLPDAALAIVTENELYATQARTRVRREARLTAENFLRDLAELKVGDPVVHVQHGIGRYLGLVHMDLGEGETEFLHLEYQDADKLYVPVSQLALISRYSGAAADLVTLHKLGSGQWDKAKRRAAQQVRDTAAELLALYARRAARQGHAFSFKGHDLDAFAEGFGFEETPDQLTAIDAVVADMQSGKPMDRLVCGDVGFGKTEVALRAAFVAVADGKQVAVLAPTTLLAEQHWQTFSDRFADWPIKVAEISRFKSAKEQAQALKDVAEGRVDILIGTHRLLQKDVKFARLGLVIIDEEHRFGVRQKEALKALRAEVDVLTLTATPIPRTLGMALEGIRDFSVIATAPSRRLAIKTFVQPWSRGLVREAVLREFKRGGQVYYLYNEVDTIERMRATLTELLPEARIVVGHGQLPERELERVMRDFTQQRANLLLCSTIIETGIDNPHANTILMHRADRFGLAQLHQLRGRVGRSHHQAYAYLLTDPDAKLTPQAERRLEAIQMMEELGSGFYLAMHDLEIRGAGEVLGENQSGEIIEIGFNLYSEMLKRAVKALQRGGQPDLEQPLDITSEINLHTPALLPSDYCPDVHERLTLYKRLSNCEEEDQLRALQEELVDRFGALPPQTQALVECHRLRLLVQPYGVAKVDAHEGQISVQFGPQPAIDPAKVITLIQKDRHTRMAGPDKLVRTLSAPDLKQRVTAVRDLLKAVDGRAP